MSSNTPKSYFGYWVMTLLTVLFVSLFFCPALRVQAKGSQDTAMWSVEELYRYMATRPERIELKVKIIDFGLKLKANGDDVKEVELVLQHDADQVCGLTVFAYILH